MRIHWRGVNGAASGVCVGLPDLLAKEGAALAFVDVQADKGETMPEQVRREGWHALLVECDVGANAPVFDSIDRTINEFGGLQIAVNCAGIIHASLVHELEESDWDRPLDINLNSIHLSV